MQLKNLYIAGDSYCFYREAADQHWPAALAQGLNLTLSGAGFPGQGWWATRQHLINYAASDLFDETDLFVLCHTEPGRMLTSRPIWATPDEEHVKEVYYKHIYSEDVAAWCVTQWYNELNQLLAGRRVVHLQCFEHPEFALLKGLRVDQPLLEMSIRSAGANPADTTWSSRVGDLMNASANHLSPAANRELAELIRSKISF